MIKNLVHSILWNAISSTASKITPLWVSVVATNVLSKGQMYDFSAAYSFLTAITGTAVPAVLMGATDYHTRLKSREQASSRPSSEKNSQRFASAARALLLTLGIGATLVLAMFGARAEAAKLFHADSISLYLGVLMVAFFNIAISERQAYYSVNGNERMFAKTSSFAVLIAIPFQVLSIFQLGVIGCFAALLLQPLLSSVLSQRIEEEIRPTLRDRMRVLASTLHHESTRVLLFSSVLVAPALWLCGLILAAQNRQSDFSGFIIAFIWLVLAQNIVNMAGIPLQNRLNKTPANTDGYNHSIPLAIAVGTCCLLTLSTSYLADIFYQKTEYVDTFAKDLPYLLACLPAMAVKSALARILLQQRASRASIPSSATWLLLFLGMNTAHSHTGLSASQSYAASQLIHLMASAPIFFLWKPKSFAFLLDFRVWVLMLAPFGFAHIGAAEGGKFLTPFSVSFALSLVLLAGWQIKPKQHRPES